MRRIRDEDITEKEINDIIGPYTETVLARELWRQYNAFNAKDKEKALEQAKKKINDLQQWVDDNSEQIIQAAEARFGDLRRAEQHMGFDCGFLYFKYKDPVYAEMFSAASTVNGSAIYRSGEFSIKLPFMTQSTTIKREMASYIKETIQRIFLIELFSIKTKKELPTEMREALFFLYFCAFK